MDQQAKFYQAADPVPAPQSGSKLPWIVLGLVAVAGISVYLNSLHQKIDQLEKKADPVGHLQRTEPKKAAILEEQAVLLNRIQADVEAATERAANKNRIARGSVLPMQTVWEIYPDLSWIQARVHQATDYHDSQLEEWEPTLKDEIYLDLLREMIDTALAEKTVPSKLSKESVQEAVKRRLSEMVSRDTDGKLTLRYKRKSLLP